MYKATGGIHHFMLMGFFNQKKTNKQTNKKPFRCGKRSTALVCGQTKIE